MICPKCQEYELPPEARLSYPASPGHYAVRFEEIGLRHWRLKARKGEDDITQWAIPEMLAGIGGWVMAHNPPDSLRQPYRQPARLDDRPGLQLLVDKRARYCPDCREALVQVIYAEDFRVEATYAIQRAT